MAKPHDPLRRRVLFLLAVCCSILQPAQASQRELFIAKSCAMVTSLAQKLDCQNLYENSDWAKIESSFGVDRSAPKWLAAIKDVHSSSPEAEVTFSVSSQSFTRREHTFGFTGAHVVDAATAQAARQALRKAADTPFGAASNNEYRDPTTGAIYRVDPATGVVVHARSYICVGIEASNPKPSGIDYVDLLFNPTSAGPAGNKYFWLEGAQGTRLRGIWETGHIFAASLGGSNHEPFNFIPQHHLANGDKSRWRRAEIIAWAIAWGLDNWSIKIGQQCKLEAHVHLNYGGGMPSPLVPSDGTYCIRLQRKNCLDKIPVPSGYVDIEIFRREAKPIGPGNNMHEMCITWKNKADLVMVQALPVGVPPSSDWSFDPHVVP